MDPPNKFKQMNMELVWRHQEGIKRVDRRQELGFAIESICS